MPDLTACPEEIYCEANVSGDTIIVSETEKSASCRCDCLYDLDIKLTGVEAKSYTIKMKEQYCGEQEKLEFGVDLASSPNGEYCANRTIYPWGL